MLNVEVQWRQELRRPQLKSCRSSRRLCAANNRGRAAKAGCLGGCRRVSSCRMWSLCVSDVNGDFPLIARVYIAFVSLSVPDTCERERATRRKKFEFSPTTTRALRSLSDCKYATHDHFSKSIHVLEDEKKNLVWNLAWDIAINLQ